MRTLIDLPEAQVAALDHLSKTEKKSRAALIRQAIADYLAKRNTARQEDAFGLWGNRKIDGLEYQRRMRREW
jgi:metal-responsive CopG/Arc/MetJ family transcriptional regulator